jgi:class 3 adenylate cyclase
VHRNEPDQHREHVPARTNRQPSGRATTISSGGIIAAGSTRTLPPANHDHRTPPAVGLPRHRAIIAVDIEQSTSRPDPVKAEFRRALYALFDEALRSAGVHRRHRDRFTDRGDGLLALIHPVDQAAKPVLLSRVIPALSQLLADYNASLPRAARPPEQLRVRVVVHAGEVHYDNNGCFGEALDIAFRLLDAPGVKKALRNAADPLTLVISGDIYRTIVRHGYDGIDPLAFRPLIRVHVAGHRYPGWVHTPRKATQFHTTEIASYQKSASFAGHRGTPGRLGEHPARQQVDELEQHPAGQSPPRPSCRQQCR